MNACCLFFPLVIREPVLYLEHVGGDWLQLGGHRQLWLDGDVDHGVVSACLPEREVLVGVPLVDVPGQVGEELGDVVGDWGRGEVCEGEVGLLVVDLRGDSDVNVSPQ